MEEKRIDVTKQTPEEIKMGIRQAQDLFRFNTTMPYTPEYEEGMRKLFPNIGEGSQVLTPLTGVRFNEVKIGKNSIVMNGCLMMGAGGITIEDEVQIAANVQLISNNHDLEDRNVITCKPVRICRRVWIGAGSTILPGVTIGENSVVGAGSVVTKDVPPDTIVAGNPAKIIRKI